MEHNGDRCAILLGRLMHSIQRDNLAQIIEVAESVREEWLLMHRCEYAYEHGSVCQLPSMRESHGIRMCDYHASIRDEHFEGIDK